MRTIHSTAFALPALVLAVSCGCSSAPQITRGQNPVSDSAVTPAGHDGSPDYWSHGHQPAPLEATIDHFRYTDISRYEVDENGEVVPYDPHSRQYEILHGRSHGSPSHSHGGAACPPHPACPRCQGSPPHGQACPVCQSGHGMDPGSGLGLNHDCPEHHFTYAYNRPKNLLYPPPQVPGGAVVYPYYTHKGPSDFFRDDD